MISKFKIAGIVLIITGILLSANLLGQEVPVIIYKEPGKIYMRWPALHQANLAGYNVYRKLPGQQVWDKLNIQPLRMLRTEQEIRLQAGYKADLFLQLFGAVDPARDISDQLYRNVINDPESRSFLDVMTLVNPGFGPLMGVVFTDSVNLPEGLIQYKITTITSSRESDYALSSETDSRNADQVPHVTGLTGVPGNQSARLVWDKDGEALKSGNIVSYSVYRSDKLLGPYVKVNNYGILPVTVSSGDRTSREKTEEFREKYLENGKSYYYYVRAFNAFGIEGPSSATVEITPGDDRQPAPPRNLEAQHFGTGLKLSWQPGYGPVKGFEVYKGTVRNGAYRKIYPLSDILLKPDTFLVDLDVKTAISYYYFVMSIGQNGKHSSPSDTIPVFLDDMTPPAKPGPVTALAQQGRIILRWPAGIEEDILGYEVERASDDLFRSRFLLTNDILKDTLFEDALPAVSQTTYGYVVYAIDKSYNRSEASDMVKARMPDIAPPSAPVITGLARTGNLVMLKWTKSTDHDLAGYRIYRSMSSPASLQPFKTSVMNSLADTLESPGSFYYAVSAIDSAGNESLLSGPHSINYDENENPQVSPGGSVEKSGNFIRLEWQQATRAGTAGYLVTREDVETGKKLDVTEVNQAVTSYTDRFAKPDKEYVYYIRTYDERWRMSDPLVLRYVPGR